jgi:hypothetical protein
MIFVFVFCFVCAMIGSGTDNPEGLMQQMIAFIKPAVGD